MGILDFLFPKYCLECKKSGQYICDDCLCKVSVCNLNTGNFSLYEYEGVIRKAIISLKYKFAFGIVDELVEACLLILRNHEPQFLNLKSIVLVPIPLYRQRENWRGFNQSEIIGKKIADSMNWKFVSNFLIRSKNTKSQVGLKGLARHQNLRGVFSINPNSVLSTKYSVLLFDDVYTTGSTIKEAKKVLNKAGFRNVFSLTIARQKLKHKN